MSGVGANILAWFPRPSLSLEQRIGGKPNIPTFILTKMTTKYVTISVKVPREVKEELERAGVKPGRVAKEAIMKKLAEIRLKRLEERAEELREVLERVDVQRVVSHIREDRESR